MSQKLLALPSFSNFCMEENPPFHSIVEYQKPRLVDGKLHIEFDPDRIQASIRKLQNCLVGKLSGPMPELRFIRKEIFLQWNPKGSVSVSLLENNCLLFKFELEDDLLDALIGEPLTVAPNQSIILQKWTPEFNPLVDKIHKMPIWVRFPGLPLYLWEDYYLFSLATLIGRPLKMDDDQTVKDGGLRTARVCVEVDCTKPVPEGVWIGPNDTRKWQAFEYETVPRICSVCNQLGHGAGDTLCTGMKESLPEINQGCESHRGKRHQDGINVDGDGSGTQARKDVSSATPRSQSKKRKNSASGTGAIEEKKGRKQKKTPTSAKTSVNGKELAGKNIENESEHFAKSGFNSSPTEIDLEVINSDSKKFVAADAANVVAEGQKGMPCGASRSSRTNSKKQYEPAEPAHKVDHIDTKANSFSIRFKKDVGKKVTVTKPLPQTGMSSDVRLSNQAVEDGKAAKKVEKEAENRHKLELVSMEDLNKRRHTTKPSQNVSYKRGRKLTAESSESWNVASLDGENVTAEDLAGLNAEATSCSYPRRSGRQKKHVTYNGDGDSEALRGCPSDADSGGGRSKGDPNKTTTTAAWKRKVSSEENLQNGKEQAGEFKKKGDKAGLGYKKEYSEAKADIIYETNCGTVSNLHMKLDSKSVDYPEPEFYDFDKDRAVDHFKVDQIWAIFDDSLEVVPRFYARIRKVFSSGFKLRMTWLEPNPKPEDEEEVDWVSAELPVACGNFRFGKSEDTEDIHMFSHLASCGEGSAKGTYDIYPRKGDIWALFKGWDIKWSLDPENHRQKEFEIVEVLSDYAEDIGVKVGHLVKVKGFTSLFWRAVNSSSFQISRSEIFRFSHKIPYYAMTGDERGDIPAGSFELDPASVPDGLEEFAPAMTLSDVKVEVESIVAQCYKYATGKEIPAALPEIPKTPEKLSEPNEMTVQETETLVNGILSPGKMGSGSDKKPIQEKVLQSAVDEWKSSETVPKCRVDKKTECLDDAKNGSNNGTEINFLSPAVSLGNVCECPDSEFHKFETNIRKFRPGQFWALYSEQDSLPKYYARVKKVLSASHTVQVTWLEACPTSEEEIQWSKDFPVGCGTFRISTPEALEVDTFSHQVRADQTSKKNVYKIYPREHEIWAVYSNWVPGGSFPGLENCEYEMVEVLKDTGSGLGVLALEKVEGYNSVFKRGSNTKEITHDKLLTFSHQVPAFQLTEEGDGKLRGYFELDPASVPGNFFCTTGK